MKPFLVFEGVDGSGKTTLSKSLAERVGAVYLRTPGSEFAQMRAYIDNGTQPDTKLLYYLSSVIEASAKIRQLRETQPVICDRYVWSSLIPHATYFNKDLAKLENDVLPFTFDLARPTQTILLTLPEEEQLRRISLRNGEKTASDKYCMQQEARRKVRSSYESIAKRDGWRVIDTNENDVETILNALIAENFQGELNVR